MWMHTQFSFLWKFEIHNAVSNFALFISPRRLQIVSKKHRYKISRRFLKISPAISYLSPVGEKSKTGSKMKGKSTGWLPVNF